MDTQLTNFIRALRSSDVRVSTGEAIDAARAVALMGYDDRTRLKDTLRCVLPKSSDEIATYDNLFDLYFSRKSSRQDDVAAEASPSEDGRTDSTDPVTLMESGDEAAIATAIEQAAAAAGIEDIRFSTQVAFYAQQMVKAMGGDSLQERLLEALQANGPDADIEAERLIAVRREMTRRARERAEQAFDVFGAGATEQFRDDYASRKNLSAIDRSDLERMKNLIRKIARKLAVKHSRRRRKTRRGQLNIRRTMRENAGFDGVPFNVVWRHKRKDRPKILVICDVSGSVARYVRFLLLLLWSMKDTVPDMHAFAFSNRLHAVDDLLNTDNFDAAMETILRTAGMGSTSYGQAFSDMKAHHEGRIDRRTTIIVLGDGRSNYDDPRTDLFREFAARAKRVIWLNPEGPALWGTGDSEILKFRPYCAHMSHVATLKDLERAVDDVLAAYN